MVGVSDARFLETIAGALARLGVERALVVAAEDGLDELSIAAGTNVVEVNGEQLQRYTLAPVDVGIEPIAPEALERDCAGGTPAENAAVTRAILAGEDAAEGAQARLDLALINAGAAIYAGGRADSIADGVEAARAAIDDGEATRALERFVRASHDYAPAQGAR